MPALILFLLYLLWRRKSTVAGLALVLLPLVAHGQTRSRVDLYSPNGQREGYVIIDGSRLDFYDKQSRRTGYGRVNPDGWIERFSTDGKRQGSGRIDGGRGQKRGR